MTDQPPLLLPITPAALATLPHDSLVVCATLRLAQTLTRAHDASVGQRSDSASASWPTLQSTTLSQWLLDVYAALALRGQEPAGLAGRRVLDVFAERLIWEQVIHEHIDQSSAPLFDVTALAATAAEAHALTIHWNIAAGGSFAAFASFEQMQFHQWQQAFLERCRTQHLIDNASLHAALIEALAEPTISLPTQIVFAGFDHFSPLERRLQVQLQTRGCPLHSLVASPRQSATVHIHRAADRASECLAVAHWANGHLQAHPVGRIALVAPDLASYQRPLSDALDDVLDPGAVLARHAARPRPYNISLGQPLAAQPLARCALTLLHLLAHSHAIEQADFSELLLSPYWGDAAETDARARLDAHWREALPPIAPLKSYRRAARYFFSKANITAPRTLAYLDVLIAAAEGLGKHSRLPSAWRHSIEKLLIDGGWLADAALSSHEFQAREAFAKELAKLAQLDQISGKITFSRAVALLRQRCTERLFQPQTRGNPPIQILGVLEAAGLEFDAVWMLGLHDNAWPPAAKPNPLLPAEAQRAAAAPNACAAVQLDFARRIQQRLLRSAPEVHLSYPRLEGATALQPSPLLPDGVVDELIPPPAPWAVTSIAQAGAQLTTLDDAQAPPVAEGETVRGGTGLLRAQAICPAWGYYRYRLGAKPLATPVEGLDALTRGNLVHDALELFWRATESFVALRAMDDNARHTAIESAVRQTLERFNTDSRQTALAPRLTLLEQQRLENLLDCWLQFELGRNVDFVVLETESQREISIEGIAVRLRIDRIDQLTDGRRLIIDYKTGASIDIKNWASTRLSEPQLPIYAALAETTEVAGVAFAQVRIDSCTFKGIAQADALLPGVNALDSKRGRRIFTPDAFPDWPSLIDHWRAAIQAVAREVKAGEASVRFNDAADLAYCEVLPLLRLAERQQQLDAAHRAEAATS